MARRHFIKGGEAAAVAALDYIVVGAHRDPPTAGDSEETRTEHRCHRCKGDHVATRWHDFYECADNEAVDGRDETSRAFARRVRKEASEHWLTQPCLYARGIVPTAGAACDTDCSYDDVSIRTTAGFAELLAATMRGYSDGSGGDLKVHPKLRRATCGAATFALVNHGDEAIQVEGLTAEVPGRQTVPRRNMGGGAGAIPRSEGGACIERRGRLLHGANGDLWSI